MPQFTFPEGFVVDTRQFYELRAFSNFRVFGDEANAVVAGNRYDYTQVEQFVRWNYHGRSEDVIDRTLMDLLIGINDARAVVNYPSMATAQDVIQRMEERREQLNQSSCSACLPTPRQDRVTPTSRGPVVAQVVAAYDAGQQQQER